MNIVKSLFMTIGIIIATLLVVVLFDKFVVPMSILWAIFCFGIVWKSIYEIIKD